MSAKRASVCMVPDKNAQHQHSKVVLVKWSFSRRLGGYVSHTREGVHFMARMRQSKHICATRREDQFLLRESMHEICTAIVASTIMILPAFADDHQRGNDNDRGHHFHGAPGPIAGTGLPVIAVGFGVYWLVRRRRKTG